MSTFAYGDTSGWSGSDTSRDRAVTADRSGTTNRRKERALRAAAARGVDGITVAELRDMPGWDHHGTASGTLSILHKEGSLARLSQIRGGCKVYVLPVHVNGRMTERHGRRKPVHAVADPGDVGGGVGSNVVSIDPAQAEIGFVARCGCYVTAADTGHTARVHGFGSTAHPSATAIALD